MEFGLPGAVSVSETAGNALVDVQREGDTNGTTTVQYATTPHSATAGSDYTTTTGTLTFAPGDTTQEISVPITDDAVAEDPESFSVVLSAPSGSTLGGRSSEAVLVEDDDVSASLIEFPTWSTSSATVDEGDGTAQIAVVREGFLNGNASVHYASVGGTATSGSDYEPISGTVNFGPGESTQYIDITPIDDAIAEGGETIIVGLSGASGDADVGPFSRMTIALTDDDAPGVVYLDSTTTYVNENGAPNTSHVNRQGGIGRSATVHYATANGTATAPTDYTTTSGTLTFAG